MATRFREFLEEQLKDAEIAYEFYSGMSETVEKKKRGRPSNGYGYRRVSIRLTEREYQKINTHISKMNEKYPDRKISISDVVRKIISESNFEEGENHG